MKWNETILSWVLRMWKIFVILMLFSKLFWGIDRRCPRPDWFQTATRPPFALCRQWPLRFLYWWRFNGKVPVAKNTLLEVHAMSLMPILLSGFPSTCASISFRNPSLLSSLFSCRFSSHSNSFPRSITVTNCNYCQGAACGPTCPHSCALSRRSEFIPASTIRAAKNRATDTPSACRDQSPCASCGCADSLSGNQSASWACPLRCLDDRNHRHCPSIEVDATPFCHRCFTF